MAHIPSKEQIEKAVTPNGGYTRQQLSQWGIDWPPPKGWKQQLIEQHKQWQLQIKRQKIQALRSAHKVSGPDCNSAVQKATVKEHTQQDETLPWS